MAIQTRVLGAASDTAGRLATLEIDYEDVAPFRLLKIRCTNGTAGPVAVTATDVLTGRAQTKTFTPGAGVMSLPTATTTRLVMAGGVRRGVPDGVSFEIRVPA